MKRLDNNSGFSIVEALLILLIVGILGFTGWFVYRAQGATTKEYNSAQKTINDTKKQPATAQETAKAAAMATWSNFSNTTIGVTFRYPSDWGQAKFETMNPTPIGPNATFYKVSFAARTFTYLTVNPKAAIKEYSTTFASLKDSNVKYASTRHVFVDKPTVVGDVVPDSGNQQATIYAARLINLERVDASDIQLLDAKFYDATCTPAAYISSCYTTDELNNYQWLLESISVL